MHTSAPCTCVQFSCRLPNTTCEGQGEKKKKTPNPISPVLASQQTRWKRGQISEAIIPQTPPMIIHHGTLQKSPPNLPVCFDKLLLYLRTRLSTILQSLLGEGIYLRQRFTCEFMSDFICSTKASKELVHVTSDWCEMQY